MVTAPVDPVVGSAPGPADGAKRVFLTDAAPEGWQLGNWTELGEGAWEERKLDSDTVYTYTECGASETPGSKTVRLKMQLQGALTEVFLVGGTVQIFVDGIYFGEYLGKWEGEEELAPPPVPASAKDAANSGNAGKAGPPVVEEPPRKKRPQKKNGCDASPEMVEKLYKAAKSGDEFGVRRLLDMPIDPDGVSPSENLTPLIVAAEKGFAPVVELLLNYGADVNIDCGGQTAMMAAYQKNKKDILKLLFGAAFLSLETMVGGGPVSRPTTKYISHIDDVDESEHYRELRDVLAKCAHLNTKEEPTNVEPIDDGTLLPESLADENAHDRLREEVMRETMKSLLNASARST